MGSPIAGGRWVHSAQFPARKSRPEQDALIDMVILLDGEASKNCDGIQLSRTEEEASTRYLVQVKGIEVLNVLYTEGGVHFGEMSAGSWSRSLARRADRKRAEGR